MAITGGAKPRLDIGEGGGMAGKIGLLRQIAHIGARLQKARPAIGLDKTRRDVQKRRFARTIASDETQTLARRDRKRGGLQERLAAEGERNILQQKERGCHARPWFGEFLVWYLERHIIVWFR